MSILFLRAVVTAAALLPYLATAAPLSLEAALQFAAQRSETTRAARASALSATETAQASAQLPDPTLRIGVDNLPATGTDRFHTARDSMTMKRIGISQEWLSADKRAARRAAADAAVGREAVLAQAATADTRRQTALAYVDAFYAGESLKLARLMAHHAHEELEASRARLSSAVGSSQDVLALTGAKGVSDDETADILQQQGAAGVAFQRWVGMPPDDLLPPGPFVLPAEDAYVAAHPTVGAMQREVEVATRTAAVTASNRKPNWTWEVAYGQRTGYSDMVSVGVSIPLPLAPGERQDRDTAAKLALVEKAEADLAEATRAAIAEFRSLRNDEERLEQRIDRYRAGVVVPASQRTAAAVAGYRSNQGSLIALFEARHAEVEAQRKLLALQRDLARTQVQLTFRPLTVEVAQ
ncbi:TolC family protein [Ramlibacter sp. H39-3-26]|uniref:TolC family protein n=1 Tax=Curvibacter soli TaxID=3031331 RepID=UPI0023DC1B8C|nr:TolC family protein [Ramlibacter sp. H39-3-26]MDF1484135.1 TolC family protein [Ramlibacter sp. H39-3-26]